MPRRKRPLKFLVTETRLTSNGETERCRPESASLLELFLLLKTVLSCPRNGCGFISGWFIAWVAGYAGTLRHGGSGRRKAAGAAYAEGGAGCSPVRTGGYNGYSKSNHSCRACADVRRCGIGNAHSSSKWHCMDPDTGPVSWSHGRRAVACEAWIGGFNAWGGELSRPRWRRCLWRNGWLLSLLQSATPRRAIFMEGAVVHVDGRVYRPGNGASVLLSVTPLASHLTRQNRRRNIFAIIQRRRSYLGCRGSRLKMMR